MNVAGFGDNVAVFGDIVAGVDGALRLQSSVCPCPVPLHGPVQFAIVVLGLSGTYFPKQMPLSVWIVTLFLWSSPLIIQNGISIGSAVFVWVPKAMLYNALSMGKKPPKFLFLRGFRHHARGGPSHGRRQHAQKLAKIARMVREISSRTGRHTGTHTQTYSLQYFATGPAVIFIWQDKVKTSIGWKR